MSARSNLCIAHCPLHSQASEAFLCNRTSSMHVGQHLALLSCDKRIEQMLSYNALLWPIGHKAPLGA